MSLLVVGLSYRTAPVTLLEQATVSSDELPKVLRELLGGQHVSEAMVLSTCNRVEIYADVDRFHGGVYDMSSVLARRAGVDVPDLGQHVYVHYEDAAVAHLFSVAAGLDSMVIGEAQILGQLRSAYAAAARYDAVGRVLHDACQHALRVGKRVHSETGIDRAGASVVAVGLAEAERSTGPLAGRRVLVLGAGSMGSLAAGTLRRLGVTDLAVANRSVDRARRLAGALSADGERAPVRALPLHAVPAELAWADLVVCCTGSLTPVVRHEMVEAVLPARAGRPLVLLDLALPRGMDNAAGDLAGVRYVDLSALQESGSQLVHEEDVALGLEIVSAEVSAYLATQRALAVGPTVAALRARAAQVVDAELLRLDGRLPGLPGPIRDEVAHAVHRVVQALLHAPTVRVKELAGQPGGDAYAEALRELFGLDPTAPEKVASLDPAVLAALPDPEQPEEASPRGDARVSIAARRGAERAQEPST
jgi:glutamyl-tRNA reductase